MKIPIGLNIEISISSCYWQEHNKDYKDIITSCCALICQNVTEGKALNKFTQIELGVVLCDDDIIHKLNNNYRKKDSATNVLSFCGFDQDEIETYLRSESVAPSRPFSLGESYISFETLNNEAKAAGIPFNEHFSHLVIHGILHLLGYDHIQDNETEITEALEVKILAILGIDDPYAA